MARWSRRAAAMACRNSRDPMRHRRFRHARRNTVIWSVRWQTGFAADHAVDRRRGEARELGVNRFYDVSEGEVFELTSQGGGGFGDPFERAPEQVKDDVVNGFVSIERALEDYGVVLKTQDRGVVIDFEETFRYRSARRKIPN